MGPVGATAFIWYVGERIQDMLDRSTAEYGEYYKPGGIFGDGNAKFGPENSLGAAVAFASFYLAACTWLKQRVAVTEPGHIERHHRKQLARDMKQQDVPVPATIKVVHLRRAETRSHEPSVEGEHAPREWSCRWGVEGHWRNQPIGPGRAETKLIYIMPFVKGPADKPFKAAGQKVFKVVR